MVYTSVAALDFRLGDLPAMPRPQRVLLTTPRHFRVEYVINPHMEGNIGTVDPEAARQQWDALRRAYAEAGTEVATLDGAEGLPDMVFCANQTLPYLNGADEKGVVLSRMHAPQRAGEVSHYAAFFENRGYAVDELPENLNGSFEGMGDALWHPGRRLLWGGYGFRTDRSVYDYLSRTTGAPVLALSLSDPDFYHLDTCLCPLDEHTALCFPSAFDEDGLALIQHVFDRVLVAPEDEARHRFACNAHSPDGRHVIIHRGCDETVHRLREAGFTPVEVDTSEFLKSGGSVFCMKQMFW